MPLTKVSGFDNLEFSYLNISDVSSAHDIALSLVPDSELITLEDIIDHFSISKTNARSLLRETGVKPAGSKKINSAHARTYYAKSTISDLEQYLLAKIDVNGLKQRIAEHLRKLNAA